MSGQFQSTVLLRKIPEPDDLIITSTCQSIAIGAKRNRSSVELVNADRPGVARHICWIMDIPDENASLQCPYCQLAALNIEGESGDGFDMALY